MVQVRETIMTDFVQSTNVKSADCAHSNSIVDDAAANIGTAVQDDEALPVRVNRIARTTIPQFSRRSLSRESSPLPLTLSKRDLRMIKLQQKISWPFLSD